MFTRRKKAVFAGMAILSLLVIFIAWYYVKSFQWSTRLDADMSMSEQKPITNNKISKSDLDRQNVPENQNHGQRMGLAT